MFFMAAENRMATGFCCCTIFPAVQAVKQVDERIVQRMKHFLCAGNAMARRRFL